MATRPPQVFTGPRESEGVRSAQLWCDTDPCGDPSSHHATRRDVTGDARLAIECVTIAPSAGEPWFEGCEVTLGGVAHGAALDFLSLSAALDTATRQAIASFVWHGGARPKARVHTGAASAFDGHAIRLDAIAGYSPALRVRQEAALGWTPGTELVWVEAHSLRDGSPRWIPAQLVMRVAAAGLGRSMALEPELRPRVPTGVGVHPDRPGALLSALLDVVERDAFMVTWLDRLTTRRLDARALGSPVASATCERLTVSGLEVRAAALPTDAPVPVVVAAVAASRGDRPWLAVGVAARRTVAEAFEAAATRAFASHRRVRMKLAERRPVPSAPSRLNAETRALWWATAGPTADLDWLVCGDATGGPADAVGSDAELSDRLVSWVAAADEDAVTVELADEALVGRLHHHVVAVVAPRLHPLHVDEGRPARSSTRLRTVPAALGRPLPAVLNTLPHPLG